MICYWENSGISGTLIRIPLIIINQIFLSLGVIYMVIVGLIQYIVSESPDSKAMQDFSNVSGALFILGVIILFVCIIGLIASCHANRTILIVYEVALIMVFIIHIVFIGIVVNEVLKSEKEPRFIREILKEIEENPSYYIIPNVVALVIELFFLAAILFLIKRLPKNNQSDRTAVYSEIKMSDLSQHNTYPSL